MGEVRQVDPLTMGQGYEARLVIKRLRLTVTKPVSSKGNGHVK
jgi:hypothetical protein